MSGSKLCFGAGIAAIAVACAAPLPFQGVGQAVGQAVDQAAGQARQGSLQSGAAGPATIKFSYENPGLDPARYTIVVDETGRGHYHSEPAPHAPDPTSADMPVLPQDTDIRVSPATLDYLFAAARARKRFDMECEDGKGKVAFQGKKTLAYTGSDGAGACTYNWSKDDRIDRLTRIFEGISLTLDAGERLTMYLRHDPLALDKELGALIMDVKEGRAMEVENISEQLQKIAQDDSVMERARERAATLLREPGAPIQ